MEESFAAGLLDWPHYTRPEVFEGRAVPAVLSSGNHAHIAKWRLKEAVARTWQRRPDLIVLDLGLPAGDGFLVMERLNEDTYLSLIPVLVVSARDRLATKARVIAAGARAFLQKPVDNAVLLAYIHKILDEPVGVKLAVR